MSSIILPSILSLSHSILEPNTNQTSFTTSFFPKTPTHNSQHASNDNFNLIMNKAEPTENKHQHQQCYTNQTNLIPALPPFNYCPNLLQKTFIVTPSVSCVSESQIQQPIISSPVPYGPIVVLPIHSNGNPHFSQSQITKSISYSRGKYIESLAKVLFRNSSSNISARNCVFTPRVERSGQKFDDSIFPDDDNSRIFQEMYNNKFCTINPKKLHFIPARFWPDQEIPFSDIVDDFFRRKNHVNCRFPHKLFNALKLADADPKFKKIAGVEWISPVILRVDKIGFSRLLGIASIEGSLFHRQGNFTTHGFCEIGFDELSTIFGLEKAKEMVQNSDYRYLKHNVGIFKEGVTEEAIESCKWINTKRKKGNFY